MKNIYISYIIAVIIATSACVEDKGNDFITPVNEISILDIEESYSLISYSETLSIKPELEFSIDKVNDEALEYRWIIKKTDILTDEYTIIGAEKNLEYPVNIAPGSYYVYLQVLDKETGIRWEQRCSLNALSQFIRGFYLFGNKENGSCGLDFVSMMAERDTTVIQDIFLNSLQLKGAENLFFTGHYNEERTALWMITESGSYSVDYSSSLSEFDIREDITTDNLIFPTIAVTEPMKIIDVQPHAFGASNMNLSRSNRVLLTENEFFTAGITSEEAYGNPKNRYSAQTSELFKPSPYIFYPGNSSYISRIVFFDVTNSRFVGLNSSYGFATYSMKFATDSELPFYFDQTKYSPVRSLIYGENGYGNAGRSYALMIDANNKYYVYVFSTTAATPTKIYGREVDQTVATNFKQAEHYAFFSMQTVILYSVGTQLWAYDYIRQEARMIQDFGSEITYLAMDYHSNNTPTDFIVATYNPSEKGIVRKFTIKDDQNKIEVTPHEKEVWHTDLKVVKVEYRNSPL